MQIKQLFMTAMSLITLMASAQNIVDQSADQGLMVRQIPNSESALTNYFQSLKVDSDTIYATIFRPANCPRCDGFLNVIRNHATRYTNKPYVLIAVYPDSTAVDSYLTRNNISYDYILYDRDEGFKDFLSFSPGYLHVGYILKINKKTGELIVGCNADNVSPEFFAELNNYTARKECHLFNSETEPSTESDMEGNRVLTVSQNISLHNLDGRPLSEISERPCFYLDNLLINDKLGMITHLFKLKNGINTSHLTIEPDSLEAAAFVNLPEDFYRILLKSKQLKNIPLQPFIINDDEFGIAYSLPELWLDTPGSMDYNYRNKPCFLVRSFSNPQFKDLVALEYDFEDKFFYPHFSMKDCGEYVVVNTQRITFPMISNPAEYRGNPEDDPFMDEFYDDYIQPTLATYSKNDGKLNIRFGELPSFAKKTKTGYSFASMIFDEWNGEAVYANEYDGNIIVSPIESLGCKECCSTYKAFLLNDADFAVPDSSDYYSYNCDHLARPLLDKTIYDIKADPESIHCIIKTGTDPFERPYKESFEYVIIDRSTGVRKNYAFPLAEKNEMRMGYGLRRQKNGEVTPYFISKRDSVWDISLASVNE